MAFPAEFAFENEAAFVQRLLCPLFLRLGFFVVVNYHGSREFGKDLILGEVDRLGHVQYHGVQAKYESSIGQSAVHSLVADSNEALASPFRHPQTGKQEYIGSFFAINGGTVSDHAVEVYFNALSAHRGRVRLLQGKDILQLDRWASISRASLAAERINGFLLELQYNQSMKEHIQAALVKKEFLPIERFRLDAVGMYLCMPMLADVISIGDVNMYWHCLCACNNSLNLLSSFGVSNKDDIEKKITTSLLPKIGEIGDGIRASIEKASKLLGPIVTL